MFAFAVAAKGDVGVEVLPFFLKFLLWSNECTLALNVTPVMSTRDTQHLSLPPSLAPLIRLFVGPSGR